MSKYDEFFNEHMSTWQVEGVFVKLLKKDMPSEDKKLLAETADKYASIAAKKELKFSYENDYMM